MLYLLYGDLYQIKNEIDKIIDSNNVDAINISKYDIDAYNYKDIIEDLSSISLFDEKKIVIISNALIFTSTKTNVDLELFEKYIENYNPNTIVIFTTSNALDERKKVTKLIRKKGIVKEFTLPKDNRMIVLGMLDEYKMDDIAVSKFLEFVGNDSYNIFNELEKLKLYKGNDYNITLKDVIELTTKNVDADLFKLIDFIIEGDTLSALEEYHNMLLYNFEPIGIIISLANKYRLLYQVKRLFKKGYTEGDIAKELKQNPKYIYVLNKIGRNYDEKYLLKQIKSLARLDYEIKTGRIDAALGFELYILKK